VELWSPGIQASVNLSLGRQSACALRPSVMIKTLRKVKLADD
jgi:hypothetical protein